MSKKRKKLDPHHTRESRIYEYPVPSREYILNYLREKKKPQSYKQLLRAFSLKVDEEREGLRRRLSAMQRDGQLVVNRQERFGLVDRMSLVAGHIQGHRDGYGWLIPEENRSDIFISARQMRQVFTDDRVLVREVSRDGRRSEGVIVEVLERNTQHVVGKYCEERGLAFVDADSDSITQDIIVSKSDTLGAKPGQFVVAKIIEQPSLRRQPLGEIVEILGDQLTPGMEVELSMRAHDLPFIWPNQVNSEIHELPDEVILTKSDKRRDLRHLHFVTIDGEDAKDFDDAIYCEPVEKGWRVFVAIADVTHYVKPNMALDEEAQLRGNSVYFPSRVIPMLPEKLSNGLCSLRPHCDRMVLVCEMTLDESGEVVAFQFDEAVIHSKGRLTYTHVADALSNHKKCDPDTLPHLKNAHKVYKLLLKRRKDRGAIEFETTETQILFGEHGKIDRIVPRERNVAHKIIEEFMLLANQTTAKYLEASALPTMYRVHDAPEESKLKALRDFLKSFGLRLSGKDEPSAKDYSNLLKRVMKRDDAHLIQTVMLRSLRQAIYTTENRGHFGLSYTHYCHFTSPIRRYPDVLVHRALKHLIHQRKPKKFPYDEDDMEAMAEHFSMTERRADRATRDATDWLKCDFMQDKVGDVFEGIVVDVTGFGIFVELKDIYVQGLVHVSSLENDYYQYDAIHHLLRARASNKTYRLGDAVRVQVARVDLDKRKIDFVLG